MQCQSLQLPDGTKAVVCGRTDRKQQRSQFCACDRPGKYLCDFPTSARHGTCDALICETCSLHLPHANDSLDFCPTHAPFVFVHGERRLYVVNNRFVSHGELIDRTTVLGNPFTLAGMSDTSENRQFVLARFREYLWRQMQKPDSPVYAEMRRLLQLWMNSAELSLRCWCAPKECHGQVIARALIYLAEKEGTE